MPPKTRRSIDVVGLARMTCWVTIPEILPFSRTTQTSFGRSTMGVFFGSSLSWTNRAIMSGSSLHLYVSLVMVSPSVSAPHAVKQHIAFEEMAFCFADDTVNDVQI